MTESGGIVFVVDDDPSMRESLRNLVRPIGLRVQVFTSARNPPQRTSCRGVDLGNHPDGGGQRLKVENRRPLGMERVFALITGSKTGSGAHS
jgi:FixJ family two-component response regulator